MTEIVVWRKNEKFENKNVNRFMRAASKQAKKLQIEKESSPAFYRGIHIDTERGCNARLPTRSKVRLEVSYPRPFVHGIPNNRGIKRQHYKSKMTFNSNPVCKAKDIVNS